MHPDNLTPDSRTSAERVEEFLQSLGVCGLISPSEEAEEFINAIIEAQCPRLGVEIAFRGDREQVLKLIRQASQKAGKVIIAAGTVLNGEDAIDAVKSGASLIVTPGLTLTKFDIERIHRLGAKVVMGVGSKEEAREAKKRGADAIKAFPFDPKSDYIKALKGPTPKEYHEALEKYVELVEKGDYPLGTFSNVLLFLRSNPTKKQKFRQPSSGETLVKEIKNAVLDVLILITGGVSVEMIEEGLLTDLGVSAALSIKGPEMIPRLAAVLNRPFDADSAGTFGEDLNFLKKTLGANNVVVLSDKSGKAQVAVVRDYQGRVVTSTADGPEGLSFGWINRELIASGKKLSHINAYGGEDRFWMGPEGGQFSIFFPKGASPEFKFEDWQTPAVIDTEPFDVVIKSQNSVTFQKQTHLTNYSGTEFDIKIDRTVRLLGRKEVKKKLRLERLPKSLKVVAYESDNGITNTGEKAWTKDNGLLSIWILGMFNPSPDTTIVIPFKPGLRDKLGKIVNDAYFGKVPADRLVIEDNVLFFRGDGQHRGKIGISPRRAKPILGSYDEANKVLTLVQYTKPRDARDYVNSMWEIQEDPYAGDVVNSYNDGPVEPGGKPLGPFYELETSSPGKKLEPNESISHTHRTIHLQGSEKDLDKIARETLGVSLEKIKNAFRGKGSPLQAAKVLIKLRDDKRITEVSRKKFLEIYRKDFSNRIVDYEIKSLRLVGLIDPDKGIIRLAEKYKDITEEELDRMNEAAQEIIAKGLDRWRLDDIPTKDISVIKEKLASIVRERKILFAAKSFLDGNDPNTSILNLEPILTRVYDSETLRRIMKGARDYAEHLQSESIWSDFGEESDEEITLEHIGRASRDYKATEDKLYKVSSALINRIRELIGHKAQSQASPQESVQNTGSSTVPLASLRSFVSVIVAVILGWGSTGIAKEIIRNINIQGRILAELGNNTPALSVYLVLAVLSVPFLLGMLVSYRLKRLEQKGKMMRGTGIDRLLLGVGASLVAAVLVCYISIFLASSLCFTLALIVFSLITSIAGYSLNSSIMSWRWKRQERRIKAKTEMALLAEKLDSAKPATRVEIIEDLFKLTKRNPMAIYLILEMLVDGVPSVSARSAYAIAEGEIFTPLTRAVLEREFRRETATTLPKRLDIRKALTRLPNEASITSLTDVFKEDAELASLAKDFETINQTREIGPVAQVLVFDAMIEKVKETAKRNPRVIWLLAEMAYAAKFTNLRVNAIEVLGEIGKATPLIRAVLKERSGLKEPAEQKEARAAARALKSLAEKSTTPLAEIFKEHEDSTPDSTATLGKEYAPLLVVKNILWGTCTAVALGIVVLLLQQFAPHLLPAFLQGEFSFFTILTGILGGIIPVVFLHEFVHWFFIALTDSLKVGRFVRPRIAPFRRDGKGRLMIGIGRRDDSPLTMIQSLAGPLIGLAAILFVFFSPLSVPVTLGITLTIISINLSSFLWGDFERMLHSGKKMGARKQEAIKACLIKGVKCLNAGRVAEAREAFGEVLRYDPQNAIAYCEMGFISSVLGEWDKAISYLTKAIEHARDYRLGDVELAKAYSNRGIAYKAKGQPEKAMYDLNQSVKYNPHQFSALFNIGLTYAESGDSAKAKIFLSMAANSNPTLVPAVIKLAKQYGIDLGLDDRFGWVTGFIWPFLVTLGGGLMVLFGNPLFRRGQGQVVVNHADILGGILSKPGGILAELGNNTPELSIYSIVTFLGIGVLVGILFSYKLKRLEMKDKMMDQSGIRWFKSGIGSWLLATLVGSVAWICITKVVTESTFSPLAGKTLHKLYLALTFIFGYIFGDVFNSVAIRLQVKKQRHQMKAKQVLDAIVDEFSDDKLRHIIEQIEVRTFKGKLTKEKTPVLYDLLERLKSILDEKGVRNNLPEKFQKKNQIGGLFMLKTALGESPEDDEKRSRDQ
ncbi:MAG: tetratricopeptide repeat protein, partial [Candidatus Bathyarchaeota archaeon]|nr:tetratricopeptide repeat protein [Candidatus Bathyarchaeota archaeon]